MWHSPHDGPLVERPCPAASPVPRIPFLRPPRGLSVEAVLLSQRIHGFNLHYIPNPSGRGGITVPCCRGQGPCMGCDLKCGWRWYGYAVGLEQPQHKLWILELTEGAWQNAVALKNKDGQLRGHILRIARSERSSRGQCTAMLSPTRVSYELPACPDLWAVLARIWGLDVGKVKVIVLAAPQNAEGASGGNN